MTDVDYWYDKWKESTASNACIVRVTNLCNEKCLHCCSRSGPDQAGQMSIDICHKLNNWVPSPIVLNIMGGEFTVLDDYPGILVALSSGRPYVRLVTNGLGVVKDTCKFCAAVDMMKQAGCQTVEVAISTDRWHSGIGKRAKEILETDNPGIILVESGDLSLDDVTPIGRAWDNNIIPRCAPPCSCETMSNVIVTEDGMIGRCPFGYFPWKQFSETTWDDARDYVWGWRSEKLAGGMTCQQCMEVDGATQCGEPDCLDEK